MNEEIKYYEGMGKKLSDCMNELTNILGSLHFNDAISDEVNHYLTSQLYGFMNELTIYKNRKLNELYARQYSDIPSAPTFTAGDQ
jgi:hypothetical protein